jgi:hypothetical protein
MPNETNNIIQVPGIEMGTLPPTPSEVRIPGSPEILLRIINDYITYEVSVTVPYIDAEDANFYPIFYVPNVKCFLIEARERHTTASTSGTLTIEKLTNGTARGSGQSMLASTFNLAAGANRIYLRGPTTVFADTQLNPGDAVALRSGGTLTSLRNVSITALFGMNMKDIPSGQSASTVISGL